ncbi:50S ribosomal protein L29 [Mycoplasma flocculare]|uniref:Large ribosomal subunit protein uL29 n=2 Tax=Mesomycoplasma flocculare TaxID=2128 RepID=A0A0A8E8Q7_MESFC|nr:50S ribosomal protein L29 [Mesomycoplasma flocculare]MXR39463.1 50S ribosomal protein L29 [Mycoplasma sp. MF12]AJC49992.1 50S ribosomal protein L29 [Mesomycoplasma flocculare ATCC 27399]ENX50961.1 50S ribosomal protein L29 [Mesomycoplasma flocculare ATCC 27716]MXR05872.1 50S ribosomal protein L29 [Mesomycoplasma flocculare]MXR12284.1 50S ribosomal protein L29 [Mesomycoplasma flocculare]
MEFKELLKKSSSELNSLLLEYRSELFTLRFKNQSSNLEQSHKIAQIRKIIARILTIISQKNLQENPKPKKLTKKQKKAKKFILSHKPKSLKSHFRSHIKPLLAPKIQNKIAKPVEMSAQNE